MIELTLFLRILPLFCLVLVSPFLVGDESESARDAIAERLQPFGNSCLEGEECGSVAPTPTEFGVGLDGKGVYDKYCSTCHETGVSEAPLVASEAWAERVAKGAEVLLTNTKTGFNVVMPAKGNCLDCTDGELQAAIDFMVTGEEDGKAFPD